MVLLGDCAMQPYEGDHRYFRGEIATEMATPYPMFYVVGNHDVDSESFPIKRFEQLYGPSQFYFFM